MGANQPINPYQNTQPKKKTTTRKQPLPPPPKRTPKQTEKETPLNQEPEHAQLKQYLWNLFSKSLPSSTQWDY